ncbi:putative serine esterase-domain-containing protein [Protomyces lactucae-debilis]|uniref:Putative serine esterase-domain-containing protein n=1 Tax=Protomyces lactucae-debilis TaxID=2754530 RepID=A0A1Y2F095_PROLT|nr:putative serine esterase-domain-containing protein [Protomyces lactucae-debilis]ORY76395.1 putative serine esterase-domain-containing protein [Protomyces lactucae-debilis]
MSDHLFVLVHGLWGKPGHLWCIKESLQERHPACRILVSDVNEGNRTYDGVDTCGERIATEIMDFIKAADAEEEETLVSASSSSTLRNSKIRYISIVGYSLGGLAARYAIGVLQDRGVFEEVTPVSFTTFATPHVGCSPTEKGFFSWMAMTFGPRALSMTGAHLFLSDDYYTDEDTKLPLLQVMADERSVFHKGLKRFRQRQAYANIQFDRSVPYWTAAFSERDPYRDLGKVQLQHDEAYDNVMLDPRDPVQPLGKVQRPFNEKDQSAGLGPRDYVLRVTLFTLFPLMITVFMVNAVVLTFKSQNRITLHRQGSEGSHTEGRTRLLAGVAQNIVEEVFDNAPEEEQSTVPARTDESGMDWVAPLALTQTQRDIIGNLSKMEWEKYQVHIHKTQHTHAAIICRMKDTPRVEEGKVVMRHWLDHLQMPSK